MDLYINRAFQHFSSSLTSILDVGRNKGANSLPPRISSKAQIELTSGERTVWERAQREGE